MFGDLIYFNKKKVDQYSALILGKNIETRVIDKDNIEDISANYLLECSNAYGDLIIWKQIIKYAKENAVGIVYVTHDQKEDWWNITKGKTIGPRIELRKEFITETNQEFHMYSMDGFINTYNKMNENQIDKSAIDEVIGLEKADKKNQRYKDRNEGITLSEKIARTEDTIEKIQNSKNSCG